LTFFVGNILKSDDHEKQRMRHFTLRYEWFRCCISYRNKLSVLLSLPAAVSVSNLSWESNNKYTFAEMQCDGQYCLTKMENSFVGQVICRNCGFSLLSLSLSLSLSLFLLSFTFTLSYCQLLPFFYLESWIVTQLIGRPSMILILLLKNANKFCSVILYFKISLSLSLSLFLASMVLSLQRWWLKARILWNVIAWFRI